jgi:hypothetical protein
MLISVLDRAGRIFIAEKSSAESGAYAEYYSCAQVRVDQYYPKWRNILSPLAKVGPSCRETVLLEDLMDSLEIAVDQQTRHGGAPARCLQTAGQIIAAAVAAAFTIPIGELQAGTRRSAPIAFARQNAMYLAHVVLGLSYTEAGRAFGRDRTTAAHACRLVEDRRTDPGLDARLASLEHLLSRGSDLRQRVAS